MEENEEFIWEWRYFQMSCVATALLLWWISQ